MPAYTVGLFTPSLSASPGLLSTPSNLSVIMVIGKLSKTYKDWAVLMNVVLLSLVAFAVGTFSACWFESCNSHFRI